MADLQDLTKQFDTLVQAGDEKAARAFLVENLQEFPQDMREKIILAFFAEAAVTQADEIGAKADIQKEGADALDILSQARAELENAQRITELQDQLGRREN
ncbi:hypothetical protein COU18_03795 [Candidatus Kaiserbacteria bacterium CG10_big_fil_rev_8_21_14_0_10_51_14]|uniref:Uncharacterized protein n=1 Tax=Candidatus Kaiserbacteria bacterium CG10_big_fil_rev_8_21_14_0_10_51_14 TaxID=1974610 RepID=A0A2H0UBK6_9BACT|nr:MAG: hypothetical protein COU18_03795 [Candidatus Kaiserbacteria bacterium CG10_big_fil_rev_8_21_14_0_10_51_14]